MFKYACVTLKQRDDKAVKGGFGSRAHHMFTASSLLFSRWRNLPGHLQRLFTHGLQQPRKAETPQRRTQNLKSLIVTRQHQPLLPIYASAHICVIYVYIHIHIFTQTHIDTHIFPGHPPHVLSQLGCCCLQKGEILHTENYLPECVRQEQLCPSGATSTNWSSIMRPVWSVCWRKWRPFQIKSCKCSFFFFFLLNDFFYAHLLFLVNSWMRIENICWELICYKMSNLSLLSIVTYTLFYIWDILKHCPCFC